MREVPWTSEDGDESVEQPELPPERPAPGRLSGARLKVATLRPDAVRFYHEKCGFNASPFAEKLVASGGGYDGAVCMEYSAIPATGIVGHK